MPTRLPITVSKAADDERFEAADVHEDRLAREMHDALLEMLPVVLDASSETPRFDILADSANWNGALDTGAATAAMLAPSEGGGEGGGEEVGGEVGEVKWAVAFCFGGGSVGTNRATKIGAMVVTREGEGPWR